MATHFARWTINSTYPSPSRLSEDTFIYAHSLPERRRARFLASRTLLAELLFMLYGIQQLPKIITTVAGRPHFADSSLTDFSIAYAGNTVGVVVTTEGRCGLDMELPRSFGPTPPGFHTSTFSSNESIWINNQNDTNEARAQLRALRQSVFKLTGNDEGLQLIPGAGRMRVVNQTHIEAISDAEDILVWACTVSPAVEKLNLWEYDSREGWQSLKDVQSRRSDPDGRIIRFTSQPYEKALFPH
ncbi:4'-phosphopantetheinyl transferase family protein [Dryocola sp. BD626]|uniref:4'-phosphopantetheinyl transferase family protein n=1 Tax=Dryocola sp. BD626 TaxID=3133273 RepID=UPI003F4F70AB